MNIFITVIKNSSMSAYSTGHTGPNMKFYTAYFKIILSEKKYDILRNFVLSLWNSRFGITEKEETYYTTIKINGKERNFSFRLYEKDDENIPGIPIHVDSSAKFIFLAIIRKIENFYKKIDEQMKDIENYDTFSITGATGNSWNYSLLYAKLESKITLIENCFQNLKNSKTKKNIIDSIGEIRECQRNLNEDINRILSNYRI